jgi:hypothetical protein
MQQRFFQVFRLPPGQCRHAGNDVNEKMWVYPCHDERVLGIAIEH